MTRVHALSHSQTHTHPCLCTPWPTAPTYHGCTLTPVHAEVLIIATPHAPSRGHLVHTHPAHSCVRTARLCTQGDPGSSPGQKACSKKAQCSSFRRVCSTQFRRREPVGRHPTVLRGEHPGGAIEGRPVLLLPRTPSTGLILWLLKPPIVCFRGMTRSGLSSPATRWPPRSR